MRFQDCTEVPASVLARDITTLVGLDIYSVEGQRAQQRIQMLLGGDLTGEHAAQLFQFARDGYLVGYREIEEMIDALASELNHMFPTEMSFS
ncbi:hypothetical protein FIV42_15400 [Persicimonas caeni]|uniref:Uncharacterized protein n=1 Tax=Persicimonas caeni TaxID=2292766 RepID=A0A4Y6PUU1_PERCE|nr:hypothetical protein [Persicimonas caeni]QDG52078.1 hypothetical protein FIV42_15400 [Persicimonas caeni]QED33299.1 hypothetical protein FRD00_15395 [Persicimonas caeni]